MESIGTEIQSLDTNMILAREEWLLEKYSNYINTQFQADKLKVFHGKRAVVIEDPWRQAFVRDVKACARREPKGKLVNLRDQKERLKRH